MSNEDGDLGAFLTLRTEEGDIATSVNQVCLCPGLGLCLCPRLMFKGLRWKVILLYTGVLVYWWCLVSCGVLHQTGSSDALHLYSIVSLA